MRGSPAMKSAFDLATAAINYCERVIGPIDRRAQHKSPCYSVFVFTLQPRPTDAEYMSKYTINRSDVHGGCSQTTKEFKISFDGGASKATQAANSSTFRLASCFTGKAGARGVGRGKDSKERKPITTRKPITNPIKIKKIFHYSSASLNWYFLAFPIGCTENTGGPLC